MDEKLIGRLRGLLARTRLPWKAKIDGPHHFVVGPKGQHEGISGYCEEHEAGLIETAVNALPALLAHIERLERETERLQDGLANYADHESDCAAETDSDHAAPCNCGFWRFNDALAAAEKRARERWIKGDKADG